MDLQSIEDVLAYAIDKEDEASRFYTDLAEKVDRQEIAEMLRGFAAEERGHKTKLEQVKSGNRFLHIRDKKTLDLKIAEYLHEETPQEDLDYQQALMLAMQREKQSFRLYTDLARSADSEDLRDIFLELAQEEAGHKLRFEIEYEENVLRDN